jgi:hypothetical protein
MSHEHKIKRAMIRDNLNMLLQIMRKPQNVNQILNHGTKLNCLVRSRGL